MLPDKWQEGNQNNRKYDIDWNYFIFKLFMNKIYFTIMEIISGSTQ